LHSLPGEQLARFVMEGFLRSRIDLDIAQQKAGFAGGQIFQSGQPLEGEEGDPRGNRSHGHTRFGPPGDDPKEKGRQKKPAPFAARPWNRLPANFQPQNVCARIQTI
jgi:hypothetical protein